MILGWVAALPNPQASVELVSAKLLPHPQMLAHLAAAAVLLIHFAFILFVILGALLALRWKWMPLVHLSTVAWGVYVELSGRICPLTELENYFRHRAGLAGYSDSFIEHYLLNIIYPAGLTRNIQFILGGIVLGCNIAIYAWLSIRRARKVRHP
jgi:hypothetical protein